MLYYSYMRSNDLTACEECGTYHDWWLKCPESKDVPCGIDCDGSCDDCPVELEDDGACPCKALTYPIGQDTHILVAEGEIITSTGGYREAVEEAHEVLRAGFREVLILAPVARVEGSVVANVEKLS
jgi:hypothetical protein